MPGFPKILREMIILSEKQLEGIKQIETEILHKGVFVKTKVKYSSLYELGVASFPVLAKPKRAGLGGIIAKCVQKKTKTYPATEILPITFAIPLVDKEKSILKFGSWKDFVCALNELKISSTDVDFTRIAGKYNFPEGFLREAISKTQYYRRADVQAQQKAMLRDIVKVHLEKTGRKIDIKNVDIQITEIGLAIRDLFMFKKWQPIFSFWNREAAVRKQRLIKIMKEAKFPIILLSTLTSALLISIAFIIHYNFTLPPVLIPLHS